MSGSNNWLRVNRHNPCPICGKPDWCLIAPDGGTAICPRVQSDRRAGEAGWLHVLRPGRQHHRRERTTFISTGKAPAADFERLALEAEQAGRDRLQALSRHLGVSVESLRRLRAGWNQQHRAWTFPMTNAEGQVVGIRLRTASGRKFSVKDGREGLFTPRDLPPILEGKTLLLPEGPSDAAAALDMGFLAAGRPSCTGGTQHVLRLVRERRPARVVVVADRDEPGRLGAERLGCKLRLHCPDVRVVVTPAKDLRDWRLAGAGEAELQALIDNTQPVLLKVEVIPWHRKAS